MIHRTRGVNFECTGCGRCCFGGAEHYVHVSRAEAERIRRHLNVSSAWFNRRYLTKPDAGGGRGIALRDGRCVFLGADLRCTIYALRPVQCRTYPFWPEVLRSRSAWRAERGRCEGIDRGRTVEVQFIERQLQRQIRSEREDG